METASHLIKVLNGPHAGAQCAFADGEDLLVGNSDEADVFLSDPHITPAHFRISATEGAYLITPQEGVVLVDGRQVADPVRVTMGQVVTAGSTSLGVGPSGTLWPPLILPDPKKVSAVPEEEKPVEQKTPVTDNASEARSRWFHWAIIVTLAVVLIFSGWLLFSGSQEPVPKKIPYPGDMEKIRSDKVDEETVAKMAPLVRRLQSEFPGVNSIIDKSRNNYQLRIFVRGEEQAKKARRIIGESGAGIFAEVLDLDEIDRILSEIIRGQGLSLKARAMPDGLVLFSGYLKTKSDLAQASSEIASDLPFLNQKFDDLLYGDVVVEEITKILAAKGLSSVHPVAAADGIHFQGIVEPSSRDSWLQACKLINERYGKALKEYDEVNAGIGGTAAPELEKILGAPIAGITFGNSAWIELVNGMRLFQGSTVGNGFVLQRISQKEILLSGPKGVVRISPSSLRIPSPVGPSPRKAGVQ